MKEWTYLLLCKGDGNNLTVAACDSWQAEIGALALVEDILLEIIDINHVAIDSDDFRFVSKMQEIKRADAIYRKVYEYRPEVQDDQETP